MNTLRWIALALFAVLAACGGRGDGRPRCSECGMYADAAPRWAASAKSTTGEALRFDAPRCLFARSLRARDVRELAFTEYYTQTSRPGSELAFVAGSDLVGPMGKDFVPVDPAHAARFASEHGGRVLRFDAIDAAALAGLDR